MLLVSGRKKLEGEKGRTKEEGVRGEGITEGSADCRGLCMGFRFATRHSALVGFSVSNERMVIAFMT